MGTRLECFTAKWSNFLRWLRGQIPSLDDDMPALVALAPETAFVLFAEHLPALRDAIKTRDAKALAAKADVARLAELISLVTDQERGWRYLEFFAEATDVTSFI